MEPSTSGGHVTSASDAAAVITVTTSVDPMAMRLIGGTPAMRFGGSSTMDLASGGGGHLTTTFGGPPAAGLVGGGDGYPTAADGLLSAIRFTGGAPATQIDCGHPTPTAGGSTPTTNVGNGHLGDYAS